MQTSQSGQERQREVWRVHKLESILSTFLSWGTSLVQYIVEFSITNVTLEARFLFVRPSTATTTAGSQANIRLRASQEEGTGQKSHRFIFFFKSMIGVSVVQGIYAILGRREGGGRLWSGHSLWVNRRVWRANAVTKWQSRTRDQQNVTWVLWNAEICGVAATVTSRPQCSLWALNVITGSPTLATLWPTLAWNPLSYHLSHLKKDIRKRHFFLSAHSLLHVCQ